jgi:hypothetical protein
MVLEKIIKNPIRKAITLGLVGALSFSIPAIATADNKVDEFFRDLRKIGRDIDRVQREQQEREYWQQQQELQREQLPQNQRHYFACNYINGNQWVFPQDYVGIKGIFRVNEPLILVDYDPYSQVGDFGKLDVFAPS